MRKLPILPGGRYRFPIILMRLDKIVHNLRAVRPQIRSIERYGRYLLIISHII